LEDFIKACTQVLGAKNCLSGDSITDYHANTNCLERSIPLVVKPANKNEVVEIVRLANKHQIPLYPISQGKNWGLGSSLPVVDGCVIVDLSRMNHIKEVNTQLGYAVIEAGVTQKQLAQYLSDDKCSFFLDVTGAGSETSIIGNALERGVAYNSSRVENISALEVVLGNEKIINTGFSHYSNAKTNHLYKHGIGPSFDGLFFQSNYGIVTSATIDLVPKGEKHLSFNLSIQNEECLPDLIVVIQDLLKSKVLHCIPHIFNQQRFYPGLAPLLFEQFAKMGIKKNKAEIESLIPKLFPGKWWAIGSIQGNSELIKPIKKRIKKELKPFGKIIFTTPKIIKVLKGICRILGQRDYLALLNASDILGGLTSGVPTDATLKTLFWPCTNDFTKWDTKKPDLGPCGYIYCLPFAPMTKIDTSHLLEIIKSINNQYSTQLAVTLNPVSFKCLEGVISLDFPKNDSKAVNNAKRCINALYDKLIATGYYPYRVGIDKMETVIDENDLHWQFTRDLKRTLDPNNIIAPKRYNLT